IENLDTVIAAVAKEQPAARIHRQRVRTVDLAGRAALFAPGLDELAGLVELDDAGVGVAAVTIGNENVAIGRDQRRGGSVEFVGTAARNAALAKGHQQPPVGTELEDLVALAFFAEPVRHPDISFWVDREPVRKQDEAGAKALYELAGFVEFEDRIE